MNYDLIPYNSSLRAYLTYHLGNFVLVYFKVNNVIYTF